MASPFLYFRSSVKTRKVFSFVLFFIFISLPNCFLSTKLTLNTIKIVCHAKEEMEFSSEKNFSPLVNNSIRLVRQTSLTSGLVLPLQVDSKLDSFFPYFPSPGSYRYQHSGPIEIMPLLQFLRSHRLSNRHNFIPDRKALGCTHSQI